MATGPRSPAPGGDLGDIWPQAGGPDGNWQTARRAPVRWSVARGENVLWRTPLPETGQSGIAVWRERLFLTTLRPLPDSAASRDGADIVGHCLDARTGQPLWSVDIPGTEPGPYAYGFSDPSSPTPVTDGQAVWFVNAGGAICCCDFAGNVLWRRRWQPTTGRPFNKQFEPILVGDTLLNVEPRDRSDPRREADPWNYLRGLDKRTGATRWVADDALTHYNTPVIGQWRDGSWAVLQGRGGYHEVPEAPPGLSLTSLAPGRAGKTLWRFEAPGKALYNQHWDRRFAGWFPQDVPEHLVLDATTGALLRRQSLVAQVDWRRFDPATGRWVLERDIRLDARTPPVRVFPAWFTNIPVAGWHYFLCFTDPAQGYGPPHCVGRIHFVSGKVEYLELPVAAERAPGAPERRIFSTALTSSTLNARGIDVAADPRSRRDGWFWCFLGSPTAAGGRIYWTTFLGVTYVLDGRARTLDERALLSVNDLGPVGQTWSANSLSVAGGRLYHRSMKEVVCIGPR